MALPSCLINLKNDTPCQTDTSATQGRRAEALPTSLLDTIQHSSHRMAQVPETCIDYLLQKYLGLCTWPMECFLMSSLPEKFYSTVLGGVSPVPLAPVQGLCLNSFFFLFPCLIPPSNQEDILIGTAEQQQYHGATNFSTAEAFKK